jgi:hypothetical protein
LTLPTSKFVGSWFQRPQLRSGVLRSLRQRSTSAQSGGEKNSNALIPVVQGGIEIASFLPLAVAADQRVGQANVIADRNEGLDSGTWVSPPLSSLPWRGEGREGS